MKVAVVGVGKSGGEVFRKLSLDSNYQVNAFDSKNSISKEGLKNDDLAIVFVSKDAAQDVLNILLKLPLPVIWGTTGFCLPKDLDDVLKKQTRSWIYASNFSLGMFVMKRVCEDLCRILKLQKLKSASLVDLHHKNKLDSPSGTALALKECFQHPLKIISKREDDIIGTHALEVKLEDEQFFIEHQAHSRTIFADGVIFAAKQILCGNFSEKGLHTFESLLEKYFYDTKEKQI